ncbi:MAG: O-succinylhomoserine sulfhydrylase [Rhodospirillales bacterium]|nr:O-succinylhomoserine sulfhydrylase [Rhodospirillales bacterium]
MPEQKSDNWRTKTKLVRGGTMRSEFGETSEAIYLTSGFVYDSAEQAEQTFLGEVDHYQYSRFANPTVSMLEERLCLLEGATLCRTTASGMSAVFGALMASVSAGDRVVASRALFGSNHFIISELLPRYGITTVLVDGENLDQWEEALSQPTQAVFIESPSNPNLGVVDLKAVSVLAHKSGAKVIIDNVFATPILQKPLELGADVVVYSATKHIDGQGRCLGGAVLTSDEEWGNDKLVPFLRNTGPAISPFNAWVMLKGLETLELRVTQMAENALTLAKFLETRPELSRVLYPSLKSHPQHDLAMSQMGGGSTIVTFDIKGGKKEAFAALNRLQLIDISNNLGDAKSLVTHPATTTHSKLSEEEQTNLGISAGTIRLSVGLEDVDDLMEDLAQALAG